MLSCCRSCARKAERDWGREECGASRDDDDDNDDEDDEEEDESSFTSFSLMVVMVADDEEAADDDDDEEDEEGKTVTRGSHNRASADVHACRSVYISTNKDER